MANNTEKKKSKWGTVLAILAVLWLVGTCMEKKEKPKTDAEFYEEYLRSHPDV
jgi:hypothetical protein